MYGFPINKQDIIGFIYISSGVYFINSKGDIISLKFGILNNQISTGEGGPRSHLGSEPIILMDLSKNLTLSEH